jgi:D-threo-aldose 1-dehydrogenase
MKTLPKRKLGRTAVELTEWGFGGAPLGSLFAPVTDVEAEGTLAAAWEAGIRYFDTAPLYGRGTSERRIGAFLKTRPREEFVVSTKVGRTLIPSAVPVPDAYYQGSWNHEIRFDYSADAAERGLAESLRRLGLDRVDVALIHDVGVDTHGADQPAIYKAAMEGAWKSLAKLRSEGVVSAIGLGVNDWRVCADCLRDADPDCFLLAGRYTLLEQEPLHSLLPAMLKRGVSLIAAAPFNSGILGTGAKAGARYNYEKAPQGVIDRVKAIEAVALKHGVQLAAAALQFPLAHPAVASVLSGARSASEIKTNRMLRRERIPPGFWADLKGRKLMAGSAPTPLHAARS